MFTIPNPVYGQQPALDPNIRNLPIHQRIGRGVLARDQAAESEHGDVHPETEAKYRESESARRHFDLPRILFHLPLFWIKDGAGP